MTKDQAFAIVCEFVQSDGLRRHMLAVGTCMEAYARHYGGAREAGTARMLAVGSEAMRLEVDGAVVEVPFDHSLSDSEDAHRTLVAMLRALPGNP